MQLFYNPNITETSKNFDFDKEESNHITKVLRKNSGDILNITNGKGWLFNAKLTSVTAKKCSVTILESHLKPVPKTKVHLAVAPTKMNDRYTWFLEKATEIGITEITPVICEHSERKILKIERFNKILQAAMKQSLQCYLPKLNNPISFKDFIATSNASQKFIAHCEESSKTALKAELTINTDVTLLIGPEGDFSTNEIKMALQHQYIPVTLGNTRLRTETAAIVACHTIALLNE